MNQDIERKSMESAMDPIAENHITITRKIFDEGRLASRNEHYRKNVLRLAAVLAVVLVITAVWLVWTGGSLIYLAGEVIFAAALLFWLLVILPGNGGKSRYQAMTQGASEPPRRTTVFYQDHLEVTAESGKKTVVPYSDVEKISESRNLWVLSCKGKIGVMIKKDGFIRGNMDEVKKCMRHNEQRTK